MKGQDKRIFGVMELFYIMSEVVDPQLCAFVETYSTVQHKK